MTRFEQACINLKLAALTVAASLVIVAWINGAFN